MIFPSLSPQYINDNDRSILSMMQQFYSDAITILQPYWAQADTCNRFYVGDQVSWTNLYGGPAITRRQQYVFNRIRRIVNNLDGYQRKNRKSTICVPMENASNETADQFSKVMLWVDSQANISETQSEAFKGCLISGMNLLHVWVDYRSDPISGDIKVDNIPYNAFLIDPYFRKTDLSDCRAVWRRSYVSKKQALSLIPDKEEEILSLSTNWSSTDSKFQFMPESYNTSYRNLLTYDEFYYQDFRDQKLLVDINTGHTMEWRHDDDDALNLFLTVHPEITVIKQSVPTTRLAIVIQGLVVYNGPNPSGLDSFPFVPVFAYYNSQLAYYTNRIQGIVNDLLDPQFLYNRRRIIELDILESQITSGWKYKENALVNPADVFNLVGQGKGLALKTEAQMSDVEQILPPQVPPSMIQLSELLGKEITEVSGISEENLGMASDDIAGVLAALRQGAGLITYQGIFDQLDLSQKLLWKKILEIIQMNFAPGKIQDILGNGKQASPEFYNKNFGKYDCVIEEGVNTITQKQMAFAQMLQMRQLGINIPDNLMLEAATIQNKQVIIDQVIQQQQQQQQMQQMQQQVQMQELQSRIQLAQARAQADMGLAVERTSRVEENKALATERKAEARKDDEMALLNLVRAIKEIEGIDIANLEKLLSLSRIPADQAAAADAEGDRLEAHNNQQMAQQ